MAARAYWQGQIRLSLVSIPVEIYSATSSSAQIAFHQIHEPSGKRIKYEKVAPGIGAVEADDIVKGYEVSSWNGIFAPKGTPKEVVDTLNKAMRDVLAMKDVQEQFAKVGIEPYASAPDEVMKRLTDDIAKWNKVIDKAGIARK